MLTLANLKRVKELVKEFEGFEAEAYPDPASPAYKGWKKGDPKWKTQEYSPLTIGYGSTGAHVKVGMKITKEEADRLLESDIRRVVTPARPLIKVELQDHQIIALASFIFNIGVKNFSDSTLLKKINAGDFQGAADEFLKWDKAQGKVLAGLVKRRQKERQVFLGA